MAEFKKFQDTRKIWIFNILIFLLLVLPVIVLSIYVYFAAEKEFTKAVLARREALSALASTIVQERFEKLTDISLSFATRVQFRQFVRDKKWDQAIKSLESAPKDFPYVERVFIADPNGNLLIDFPALPGVRGRNFADRDWYKGVVSTQGPYISNVYKRAAQPQYNVIAVAVPIKEAETKKLIGILVLQVKLDTILEWTKNIKVGEKGFIYVVDRNGIVAAHPSYSPQGDTIDFSNVAEIKKAFLGSKGVEVLYNEIDREERIVAFEMISRYGWIVVAAEPSKYAFAQRDRDLKTTVVIFSVISLVNAFLIYFILRTVAKLRRSEANLARANDRLKDLDRMKDDFISIASHELRTPMTAIKGFVSMILDGDYGPVSTSLKEPLKDIGISTQRLIDLVNDLLNVSRIQAGRLKHELSEFSMNETVKEVVSSLQPIAKSKNLKLFTDKIPGNLVQGDVNHVRQILNNLIGNSLKFTTKGSIKVSGTVDKEMIKICVADTGIGISVNDQQKLFGKFAQLNQNLGNTGTGLGLYISKEIIRKLGGDVWLEESSVNKGSTFCFTLPLANTKKADIVKDEIAHERLIKTDQKELS